MKPTTEQIEAWIKSDNSWGELIVAAYAAGAAAMKERAAKVCEEGEYDPIDRAAVKKCAAAIRALGDDDE